MNVIQFWGQRPQTEIIFRALTPLLNAPETRALPLTGSERGIFLLFCIAEDIGEPKTSLERAALAEKAWALCCPEAAPWRRLLLDWCAGHIWRYGRRERTRELWKEELVRAQARDDSAAIAHATGSLLGFCGAETPVECLLAYDDLGREHHLRAFGTSPTVRDIFAAQHLCRADRAQEALQRLHVCIEHNRQTQQWGNVVAAYESLAYVCQDRGHSDEALTNLNLALEFAERFGVHNRLREILTQLPDRLRWENRTRIPF